MVRQFQESYLDRRYQSTVWGYTAPDFEHVARAYGIHGHTIRSYEDVNEALAHLWQEPTSPSLLQVMLDSERNVCPRMPFGKPITQMEPDAPAFLD